MFLVVKNVKELSTFYSSAVFKTMIFLSIVHTIWIPKKKLFFEQIVSSDIACIIHK